MHCNKSIVQGDQLTQADDVAVPTTPPRAALL